MVNHLPLTPAQVHTVDQRIAETHAIIGQLVAGFREHVNRDCGDTTRASASLVSIVKDNPGGNTSTAWLLAAAVAQLARTPGPAL